jgi:hypothetical protein
MGRHSCGGWDQEASRRRLFNPAGRSSAENETRGFEPLPAEPAGFLFHHLSHSVGRLASEVWTPPLDVHDFPNPRLSHHDCGAKG